MKTYKYLLPLFLCFFIQLTICKHSEARGAFFYSIQGTSYSDLESVQRATAVLQNKGYEAFYERVNRKNKGTVYRLYIGQYGNKSQAQQIANELKENNIFTRSYIKKFMKQSKISMTPGKNKMAIKEGRSVLQEHLEGGAREPEVRHAEIHAGNVVRHDMTGTDDEKRNDPFAEFAKTFAKQEQKLLSKPFGSFFQPAVHAIKTGKFIEAQNRLQSILTQYSADKAISEAALRLMADSNYAMGIGDAPGSLLKAIEQYKTILQNYPDPAEENDIVYYRMAASYEGVKFYYEAAGALERLIAAYPASELSSNAMFMLGDMMRMVGKYNRAIEKFIRYLNKYPDGIYVKKTYVALGDSYYHLKKDDFAGQWYDEAWKRWSDFHDLPPDILLTMGDHYFDLGKFLLAYKAYSVCVNFHPTGDVTRNALYKMGRACEELGNISLALKIYSLCKTKYSELPEADECALAMANLGVKNPNMKFPQHIVETTEYREPMKVYDHLLNKYPTGDLTSKILFFKGTALSKLGKTRDSFLTFVKLLSKFPQGKYIKEGRDNLKIQTNALVNSLYDQGDYLAISDIYFQCYVKTLLPFDDFDIASKVTSSLYKIALYDESARAYQILLKQFKEDREKGAQVILSLANIDIANGKYEEAENKLMELMRQSVKNSKFARIIKIALADLYYNREQYDKAAPIYADITENFSEQEELDKAYRNYGRSLMARNLARAALDNYLRALRDYEKYPKKFHADMLADIYSGLGDAYCKEARYGDGITAYQKALACDPGAEGKKWLLSRMGKAYAAIDDLPGAAKNFSLLKDGTGGEFWPKVADYLINATKSNAQRN